MAKLRWERMKKENTKQDTHFFLHVLDLYKYMHCTQYIAFTSSTVMHLSIVIRIAEYSSGSKSIVANAIRF